MADSLDLHLILLGTLSGFTVHLILAVGLRQMCFIYEGNSLILVSFFFPFLEENSEFYQMPFWYLL